MGSLDEVAKIIRDHVAEARQAKSHPVKLFWLSKLLEELFQVKPEELIPGIEAKLESKVWGLRGSADLIFSNVVFEVKVDLDRELDNAKEQLKKYLQVLYEREPRRKSIGIATDCVKFKAYAPVIEGGQVVELKEIGSIDIAESTPLESVLWLDSFIFSAPKIRPSAQDLRWRFGPGSPTHFFVREDLQSLWQEVESEEKPKLDLWAKNMEIVYGSKPGPDSFIDHTYLVTLAKLIVYFVLSGDDYVDEKKIVRALTGEYFSSYGIANLIEEDFFTWILNPKIADRAVKLACDLARELLRYDFSQVDEDFFKEIYEEIVERGERHRIGEYYTPEWLAQLVLKEAIELWKERDQGFPKILDPACGSGTFLCNAIHMARKELQSRGEPLDKVLEFILDNIVGVDVNPVAVIIARANYLMALGDLRQLGKKIVIPVYVADSIKMPKVLPTFLPTLAAKGPIEVYDVEVDDRHHIQVPKSLIAKKAVLSEVFEAFKDAVSAYRARANRNEALKIFRARAPTSLAEEELEVLKSTLSVVLKLIDEGLDSIWIFMLRNVYAPIVLAESKFDVVVGNPPWIAMRFVENKDYQDFLKQQVLAYELLDSSQVHLFTQMEAATLFFCRCSDLYLRDGGLIAFVMPRSVLTGALQHANFKQLKKPEMKLVKVFDLEGVSPLFKAPSCALIAVKGGRTQYPISARKLTGELPEKNVKLDEALKYLKAEDYMYEPPTISAKCSEYYDEVKTGASMYPRSLWFVEFMAHSTLGIDVSKPLVKSSSEQLKVAKAPWKVEIEGNVEADFIYATLLSKDLVPFGYVKLRPVVLPIRPLSSGYELLDVDTLRSGGYVNMANWLEKAQRIWEERRTGRAEERFPRVLDRLDYDSLLTAQDPSKRYIVLYNVSGKNVASCVIDKNSLPAFTILKTEIRPRGFIVDYESFFYETNNEMEAHYLAAILNSNVINEAIKPLQPRGLYGERHICRRPFMLPIPRFNENNPLHVKLAELSKKCHAKVASIKFTKKSTAGLRREAKKSIEKEIAEIDRLVSQLLGL